MAGTTSTKANLMIIGSRKGLLLYRRKGPGSAWTFTRHAHIGAPVSYAFVDYRNDSLWSCLDHGHWGQKLHRSRDLGESWEEIPPPGYPEGETIKDSTADDASSTIPAKLHYQWVMVPGGADQPDRLYMGTEPGGLFVSDDGGNTWSLNRGLWDHQTRMQWFGGGRDHPGIHSILVDPRDSRHVYVGLSCAGVFETKDGGDSWAVRNKGIPCDFLPDPDAVVGHDPHLIAAPACDPDTLYQQNHCGVLVSRNGAESWDDISEHGGPAYFGFAVAVDHRNAETAWVVPAISDEIRIAVGGALLACRTDDAGKSWQRLANGLPDCECYDIVFRHALDAAGHTVAFGSTTGNVYVSDDRGDTWSALGHHLPPVYSLRFAEIS